MPGISRGLARLEHTWRVTTNVGARQAGEEAEDLRRRRTHQSPANAASPKTQIGGVKDVAARWPADFQDLIAAEGGLERAEGSATQLGRVGGRGGLDCAGPAVVTRTEPCPRARSGVIFRLSCQAKRVVLLPMLRQRAAVGPQRRVTRKSKPAGPTLPARKTPVSSGRDEAYLRRCSERWR